MPQINKEKPKDCNMEVVGLGNTRILTDYAQNPPRTVLFHVMLWVPVCMQGEGELAWLSLFLPEKCLGKSQRFQAHVENTRKHTAANLSTAFYMWKCKFLSYLILQWRDSDSTSAHPL